MKIPKQFFYLTLLAAGLNALPPAVIRAQPGSITQQTVRVRFIDSATGYAVQPDSVIVKPHAPGRAERRLSAVEIGRSGRSALALESGQHLITSVSATHKPMSGEFEMTADNQFNIDFYLDPLVEPRELQPDYIAALHRDGATLISGFVVDDESGQPLAGGRVRSQPGGVATRTDARGFFQLYVPVQTDADAEQSPANLVFEKPGYRAEERQYLELWSKGDWTYRIRLQRGERRQIVDERTQRRRLLARNEKPAVAIENNVPLELPIAGPAESFTRSTAPSNATVRVPRNIRVLKSDGVTIDYVTMDYYVKHVLPAEWIASWGSINPGGSNCLNAGAVASRCYAIAKLNGVSGTSAYDICGTTSCQVYGAATSGNTDTAVNFTANYVVINSSGAIPSTEYSAENNSRLFACGDGWTQPTGGCIFDPVCSGETRAGHGRGMCQWGTAKWATGRKMTGNITSVTTPNGYPRRDWIWIVQHYYPALTLVKGAPLIIGDDVRAVGSVNVNMCPDGGITNGVNCTLISTMASGTTGVILQGPLVVTNDAKGFTWYKIHWNDANSTLGWAKENFIERIFSLPTAPTGLSATAIATNQINLNWADATTVEAGFKIERAISSSGPWIQLDDVPANVAAYSDRNLYPGSKWFYRVRAFNAGGNSGYSNTTNATTPAVPPALPAIANKTTAEGALLTFTNAATATDFVQLITDFANFTTDTTNGLPLFRNPRFSGSTSAHLAAAPDLTVVTDVYATNQHGTGLVLRINCNFTNAVNPWLRLTTASAANWPNPIIDFTKKLRFDIYADKSVGVAVGCRETVTAPGTPMGSDGGTSGAIEWAGATNIAGGAPVPNRTVGASNWTTLTFNFPAEPIRNFSGGNGILSTASGLGVLEHLAIVPVAGAGVYNLFLDNFAVVASNALTYSLDPGAPTNASVDVVTGVFTWTPTEAQGPGVYNMILRATDSSSPAQSVMRTFQVTVDEVNAAPVLAVLTNHAVHAGTTIAFIASATDADVPKNTLSYSLDAGAPPAAAIDHSSGLFTWPTADSDADTTNSITVRVADNGSPVRDDAGTFTITVFAKPGIQDISVASGTVTLTWSAIANTTYRVQFKHELNDLNWIELVPDVTATGVTASITDSRAGIQGFYRVLVVTP